jgi:nitrogen fixation protein NifX
MEKSGVLRVAFATNDSKNIDAHFGSAKEFQTYSISKDDYKLEAIIKIETKNTDKTISLLSGMDIVYFLDIGPTAAAKIINSKIFPIKYKEIVSIENELKKLKIMLNSKPAPFIQKILDKKVA